MHVLKQKTPSLVYSNTSQIEPCGNAFRLLRLLPKEHARETGSCFPPKNSNPMHMCGQILLQSSALLDVPEIPFQVDIHVQSTTRPGSATAVDVIYQN